MAPHRAVRAVCNRQTASRTRLYKAPHSKLIGVDDTHSEQRNITRNADGKCAPRTVRVQAPVDVKENRSGILEE